MDIVHAEVMPMAVTNLNMSYGVRIISPVPIAPKIYHISMQELVVRCTSYKDQKRVLWEILRERILRDYNNEVEASPIMDMFADPDKYKRCSYIQLSYIDPVCPIP